MIWQEQLFLWGNLAFAAALVPTLLRGPAPPLSTCALTAGVLWSYVVAFATLGLELSAAATGVTASTWSLLVAQSGAEQRGWSLRRWLGR